MFLPIGDTPNPRGFTPWVNWGLIAANVVVYLLVSLPLSMQPVSLDDPALWEYVRYVLPRLPHGVPTSVVLSKVSAYDLFVFHWGFKPAAPELRDLLASMFLHANLAHLGGNMLFLWIFGDNVEHRLGRVGYLVTYLATGVAATLAFAALSWGSMVPLVGASGAISGVLGLYFWLFGRNRVKVFVFLFPFVFDVILLPSRWVLGFYLVAENLIPLLFGAQSGVAYGAHLGGFVAGLVVAWVGEAFSWHWPWRDAKWTTGSRLGEVGLRGRALVDALEDAIVSQDVVRALELAPGLTARDVAMMEPAACVVLARWLQDAGHPVAAGKLLKTAISTHRGSPDLADLYLALGRHRLEQGQPTAAYQHLLAALDLARSPETELAARELLSTIDVYRPRAARLH